MQLSQVFSQHAPPVISKCINCYKCVSDKKVKFKILSMFIYMIYLCCCYVSSRRPGDVGSTVTKCSCTLLIIGHMEPKSVYCINSLHAGVLC